MQILELALNITLRLFLRPFEAVLSFKSLFEGVPDHRLSSYFTWLNIFAFSLIGNVRFQIYISNFDTNIFCIREFLRKFKNQRNPGKLVNQY